MDMLFGLLGFAGFAVGVIWSVIAKIKKQPIKTPLIVLCAGVVLFFVGAAMGTGNEPSEATDNTETTVDTVLTTTQETTTQETTTEATTVSTTTQPTTEKANTTTTTTKAPAKTAVTAAKSTTTAKKVSRTVYITPSGKKYHYNGSCNGGKYQASNLDEAKRLGLTPCKKCVG